MATTEHQPNGVESGSNPEKNGILPGTTFADNNGKTLNGTSEVSNPSSSNGPLVNGRPTTLTLFSPQQLAQSLLLPSLYRIINEAFHEAHVKLKNRMAVARLQYDGQLHDELGNNPGTFSYVLFYTGTDQVVATASAKPSAADLKVSMKGRDTTWQRLVPIADGKEAWELSTMAVDPGLQGQGLAGFLMRIVEDEVKRRFRDDVGAEGKELVLVITTVKERLETFYLRRGYVEDYAVKYEKGHRGSEKEFHVIFMSKKVDV